jgi:hypothetical protein
MRYTTQRNHMISAKSAIESLFSCARIIGMQSHEVHSAFLKILADHSKLPNYSKQYLRGIYDEKIAQCYRDSLVFGGFYNGRFYSTHSKRDDYYGKNGIGPAQWAMDSHNGVIKTGHYWITCATFKPFFTSDS